ncbi:MAG: extracellular solute-binding protein [Deltaproteobacteria bacterium]|nr:MAG: extracellular solute-binding protein [Deltaproteobacteria bacterium]
MEQLYASLAKLPAEQRTKQLEEGARKEAKLNFVHTWRGKIARDHVGLFEKRYPFVKVEMGDIGSQDAAERFIAEETAGRHLTDILTLGVPDMAVILKQNLVAKYPTPATKKILKQYQGFIEPESRWTPWYWAEHGISYNTDLIKADKAPKTWFDLCKPEFKGQVSFDPPETVAQMHGTKSADYPARPHPAHGAHAHRRSCAAGRQLFLHRRGSQEKGSQSAVCDGADSARAFVRWCHGDQQKYPASLRVGIVCRLDALRG